MQTFAQAQLAAILAAAKTALLVTSAPAYAHVKLAVGSFTPTPTSDPTTFTEASFPGYASKAINAWNAVEYDSPTAVHINPTAMLTWTPTDATMPQTITGYWMVDAAGNYLLGESFGPNAVPLTGPTTSLNLITPFAIVGNNTPLPTATIVP